MQELPKLYVEEQPDSQKRSKIAIAVMVLILLVMPLGVYLTLRSQNPNSQAAQTETRPAENAIILQSRSDNSAVNNQAVFPVDVIIRSDLQSSNLFSTRLSFPVDALEVVSVASSSANLEDQSRVYPATEWLDASFSNEQGFVNLVAGIPQSGLKTNPDQAEQQQILATVFFKAKKGGTAADVLLQEGSMMLGTENGQNVLNKAQSLTLTLNDTVGDFTDNIFREQAEQFKNTASASATFKIDTPNGGEVFPYTSAVNIRWSNNEATGTARRIQNNTSSTVAIAILMNNKFLGLIDVDAEDSGSFVWSPAATLPQAFIKQENSFKIEIERTDSVSGRKEKVVSAGPFGITLGQTTSAQLLTKANLTSDRTDVNGDTVRDYKDASFILSNYFASVTERNLKADFNNDRLINALDLWYFTQSLHP